MDNKKFTFWAGVIVTTILSVVYGEFRKDLEQKEKQYEEERKNVEMELKNFLKESHPPIKF